MTAAALLGVAAVPVLVSAAPAWADTAVSSVLASNWYWQEQDNVTPAGAPAGLPVGAPDQTSGIPAGDFGVSYLNQVDKVTALNFDVSAVPSNALVSKFAVTMPVDQSANNVANGVPLVAACPAIDSFKPGTGPSPFSQVPPQGTSVCVDGKYDAATQAYTFDIAQIATDWAAGAPVNGIVVQPKPGDTTPFNYAFKGAGDIKVAITYTSAAAPVTAAPPAVSAGVAAPPALDSGTAPVAPLAPEAPTVGTGPAPQVVPQPAPAVAPAPAPAPAAAVATTVDALRPSGLFWLALLALGAMMLMAAMVLGDPLEPVVVDPRRRRYADIVRARAAARTAATAQPRPSAPRARPV
jgi:hypothetical protein